MADRRSDEYEDSPVGIKSRFRDDMSPDEIEEEIEYTRGRVDETLNAIQDKLSPGGLIDQVIEYVRESPGKYASSLTKTIILNPLPSALVGIGIAWLLASRSGGSSGSPAYVSKARDPLDRFRERVEDRTGTSEEYRGGYRYPAKREGFSFFWEEQPLLLAMIGFTVGAVLAGSVPETRFEHDLIERP
jgi:hypothetical protein